MLKGGLGNMMKQAQQMQENMKKMQDQLADVEVEGVAGAGMVKILMTCRNDVRRVTIDPSLMSEEKEMLEKLNKSENFKPHPNKGDKSFFDRVREAFN